MQPLRPIVPRLADPARRRLRIEHAYRARRRDFRVDGEPSARRVSLRGLVALYLFLLVAVVWLLAQVQPLLEAFGW